MTVLHTDNHDDYTEMYCYNVVGLVFTHQEPHPECAHTASFMQTVL